MATSPTTSPALAIARAPEPATVETAPLMVPIETPKLNETTSLTPAEFERSKTSQQKAEDVIYTLNHAVTCLSVTDTVGIGAAGTLVKMFTGKKPDWSDHDHAHGHEHAEKISFKRLRANPGKVAGELWHNAKDWIIGEAVGDLGAVPFTVGLQRIAPSVMNGIRGMIEPIIGGTFKRNTLRAAENWGMENGKEANSQEVADYAHKLYEYEMRHMPQMAVWTVSSVALNYGTMWGMGKMGWGHKDMNVPLFIKGKAIGAGITAGLVLGLRGLTPGGAHKWDQTVGRNVIVPITKTVGGLFGVKAEDVDEFQHKREVIDAGKHTPGTTVTDAVQAKKLESPTDWQERVQKPAENPTASQGISA